MGISTAFAISACDGSPPIMAGLQQADHAQFATAGVVYSATTAEIGKEA